MKHILIICRTFPPLNLVASSRPLSWANYFAKQGNRVTVLSTEQHPWCGPLNFHPEIHPNVKVIETPWPFGSLAGSNKFLRKFSRFFLSFRFAKAACRIHQDQAVDAVISTFEPAAAHYSARVLKKKHPQILWVADYRDMWSLNQLEAHHKHIRRFFAKITEKRVVSSADVLTTVSEGLVSKLHTLFPANMPKKIIYNGFEGPFFNPVETPKDTKEYRIVYTGSIYKFQKPLSLMKAVRALNQQDLGVKIRLNFYGINQEPLIEQYSEFLDEYIQFSGSLSRAESLEVQKKAHLLLFLDWDEKGAKGILTGKLFEYIQTNTPVLSVGPEESDALAILQKTQTGHSYGKNTEAIQEFLLSQIQSFAKPSWFAPLASEINQFHRAEQAKELEKILADFGV